MTIYCIYMEIVFRTIDLLCSMVWILAECTDLPDISHTMVICNHSHSRHGLETRRTSKRL